MNVFLKQLIILIIGNLLITNISCDETIEITCTTDEDCRSYENKFIFSQCSYDACVCTSRKDDTWQECVPTVSSVSNENVKSSPCTAPNTEFRNGACRTKNVHLGKACEETMQCERNDWNSECIDEVCKCRPYFMEIDNTCRSIIQSEKCTKSDNCPQNSECVKGKCVCNKAFIGSLDHTKCLPFRSFNQECEETAQCSHQIGLGAYCKKGTCKCMPNYAEITHESGEITCRRNAFVGDTCIDNEDCFNDNLKLACIDFMCSCRLETDNYNALGITTCKKKNKDEHASPYKSGATSIKVFNLLAVIMIFAAFVALLN